MGFSATAGDVPEVSSSLSLYFRRQLNSSPALRKNCYSEKSLFVSSDEGGVLTASVGRALDDFNIGEDDRIKAPTLTTPACKPSHTPVIGFYTTCLKDTRQTSQRSVETDTICLKLSAKRETPQSETLMTHCRQSSAAEDRAVSDEDEHLGL